MSHREFTSETARQAFERAGFLDDDECPGCGRPDAEVTVFADGQRTRWHGRCWNERKELPDTGTGRSIGPNRIAVRR